MQGSDPQRPSGFSVSEPSRWVHELTLIKREGLLPGVALRSAVVTVAITAFAVASGNLQDAVPLALGGFLTALADTGEHVGQRWRTMLWTTMWLTLATALGGFAAEATSVLLFCVALVAFTCGYASSLGPRGAIIGVLALVAFNAFAVPADSPWDPLRNAAMVAIGALIQTLATITPTLLTKPRRMVQREPRPSIASRLRDHWERRDLFRLHAIRLTIAIVIGVVIEQFDSNPHANWIPIVIAWVTLPDRHGTVTKVMARIIGTLLGAIAMWFVGNLLNLHGYEVGILVAIGAFLAVWLLRANYSLAVIGITIFMLGLFDLLGQPIEMLIRNRLVDTLVAGAIVLAVGAASIVLFKERDRTPQPPSPEHPDA